MRYSKLVQTICLFLLALSCCQRSSHKHFSDIKLHPTNRKGSFASKETIQSLLYEIWESGFFRKNNLTQEEILNNTYGVFRKARKDLSSPDGRAYYQQRGGQKDLLMLNAKLFGHLEPAPKPPHMDKISIKRLDRRIRATLVHELFHDFWHNILDERRRYLFSSEAELFFIELMLAKTDEERLRFLRNSGYTQPEEVHFDSFEVLLEIKEMYNPQKTFGTELYATLAGRAFSGVTIIPKQLRKYYLSIISDEILNRNSLPLSRAPRKIKKKHEAIFIDSRDEYGLTRLHHAAYSGHKEAVQFLIEKGAEVNAEATSCAWTPVFLACLSGHLDTAEWLIGNGALIDLKDIRGRSPLHIAALRGHAKIIDLLLRLGAELDSQDAAGMTPLHAAALRGRKETASLLISLGADAKLKDSAGQTPLHIACLNGDEEVVKLLISEGVHVNERDYRGETALHIAAFCGHKKVVEFLIAHGAKFEIRNIEGKTPLEIASRARHEQIVEILRRAVS